MKETTITFRIQILVADLAARFQAVQDSLSSVNSVICVSGDVSHYKDGMDLHVRIRFDGKPDFEKQFGLIGRKLLNDRNVLVTSTSTRAAEIRGK